MPFQRDIHDVTLPVGVTPSQLRIVHVYSSNQHSSQRWRVCRSHTQRCCKETRFVFAIIVFDIEAVVAQLAYVNDCPFSIRQYHR